MLASEDGIRLYVTVGSNSNAGENGMENEAGRAAIRRSISQPASLASSLPGCATRSGWPGSRPDALWTAVNERDEIGNDLVPDYMTAVKDGGFYGWPYSYFGPHVDARVKPQRPDLVAMRSSPTTPSAHTPRRSGWPSTASALPRSAFRRHVRRPARVLESQSDQRIPGRLRALRGRDAGGRPIEVLTGFVDTDGDAHGRPVGVAIDREGALLVADDVGNVVWHVSPAGPRQ